MFERASLEFSEGRSLPQVGLDKERFVEAMTDLLERLSGKDSGGLVIDSMLADDLVRVRISPMNHAGFAPLMEGQLRFFERAFALCGAFIEIINDGKRPIVEIEFLPSKMLE
jgi:hypothetical protein